MIQQTNGQQDEVAFLEDALNTLSQSFSFVNLKSLTDRKERSFAHGRKAGPRDARGFGELRGISDKFWLSAKIATNEETSLMNEYLNCI